ncbi:unnamed protein product [Thelazia callipaeda]|uniref:Transmembrane protein n=1 Tax=Thelazia callipaeda TaxID=103827 RepID=A0A158RBQ4_THECL|nr:unnamed protein product [Thelazia callipaeda]
MDCKTLKVVKNKNEMVVKRVLVRRGSLFIGVSYVGEIWELELDDKTIENESMPKQEFEFIDFMGPLAAPFCFVLLLFVLSVIINFTCITKNDDRTIFEKFGSKFDLRCGVHRMRHCPDKSLKRVRLIANEDVNQSV